MIYIRKSWVVFCSIMLVATTLAACNDNKESKSTTNQTNVSDTRRNTTDTSNYISDSAGKSAH